MDHNIARKNIWLLIAYSAFLKRFAFPIITIYYLLNELDYTQIGLLMVITSLTTMIFEIPAGVFADKYGKRLSLVVTSFFALIYSVLLLLGDGFLIFSFAAFCFGFYFAFASGTREAILFDWVVVLGEKSSFKKYLGRLRFLTNFFNAITLITASFLFNINSKLPFGVMTVFMLVSLLMIVFMQEPPFTKEEKDIVPLFSFYGHFKESLFHILKKQYALSMIFLMVLGTAFFRITADYAQPLFQIADINVVYFGLIYAFIRFIQGATSALTHYLDSYVSLFKLLLFSLVCMTVGFLGMGRGAGIVILVGILIMNMGYWMLKTTADDEINQVIVSTHRATVLSIASFLENILAIFIIFTFSVSADWNGVQTTYLYAMFVLIFAGGLSLLNAYFKRKLKGL